MLKKILVTLLSMFFIICGVFVLVTSLYLITPSQKNLASIPLPKTVEDSGPVEPVVEDEPETSVYDNIYIADVHQSLTLRTSPDSNAAPVMEEGLAPMTHMQVINMIQGTSFAYVTVINGPYEGKEGYVNYDYITKLGEPTIRVGE